MHLGYEIIIAYLCGSIPFGLLLSSLFGNGQLRSQGSGNIGATNVLRTQGRFLGIMTLLLDALKGAIPILVFNTTHATFLFVAAVIGHLFPVWLKFKGGKGIATFFGGLLAFQPIIAIIAMFCWIIVFKISKISSLSGLISVGASLIIFAVICKSNSIYHISDIAAFSCIVFIIFYKHIDNIKRLLRGNELKIKI